MPVNTRYAVDTIPISMQLQLVISKIWTICSLEVDFRHYAQILKNSQKKTTERKRDG